MEVMYLIAAIILYFCVRKDGSNNNLEKNIKEWEKKNRNE